MQALQIDAIPIDKHCIGSRWLVQNIDQLTKLIAIILMGQATYAAHIIRELAPAHPAFTYEDLKDEATIKLTVQEEKQTPRIGYPRWQRDGLIFEVISWISARQACGANAYLKDPHISSTSQGIDGLMIELTTDGSEICRSTIFEDKCTDNPRDTFTQKVIPGFLERHSNKRSAELIAAAASLIKLSGIDDISAIRASQKILDINTRCYRAAFSLPNGFDSDKERKKLFKGYETIQDINANQRIGASLIVNGKMRDWFDDLAKRVIEYIATLTEEIA
jgi:hypothetical protein